MPISDFLLPEFDAEMASTRKMLERVPEDRLDWKPHVKSWELRHLARHVAEIPSWAVMSVQKDELDINPPGAEPYKPRVINTRQELLEMFDQNIKDARAAIAGASDEHLLKPWTLLAGGNKIMTLPRTAVLRSFVMNHGIHHRAQLGVYLRLMDVPVPGMYGPSADDPAGFGG
jgi:uncharacterized damage-inducible protein DinB